MSEKVPYQVQPQIDQLTQERANAVAYGQKDRVAAVDKQLASLGVKQEAAEERSAAADSGEAKRKPPQGRSARPAEKAAQKDAD